MLSTSKDRQTLNSQVVLQIHLKCQAKINWATYLSWNPITHSQEVQISHGMALQETHQPHSLHRHRTKSWLEQTNSPTYRQACRTPLSSSLLEKALKAALTLHMCLQLAIRGQILSTRLQMCSIQAEILSASSFLMEAACMPVKTLMMTTLEALSHIKAIHSATMADLRMTLAASMATTIASNQSRSLTIMMARYMDWKPTQVSLWLPNSKTWWHPSQRTKKSSLPQALRLTN